MSWDRRDWKEAVKSGAYARLLWEREQREQGDPNSYSVAPYNSININAFCNHTKIETMNCNCGEEEEDFAWTWCTKDEGGQAGRIVLDPECRLISFNPEYSSGTSAVRGNKLLSKGCHHFWELKMTSSVYGTNIMVGVCTPNFDISYGIHRFCTLLGQDEESWGYSFQGSTHHANKYRRYGPRWGKGSIVGVHLDTWGGTLEYFLNREPLGIAFFGLQNRELYPIVTSTSAHSGMKLVSSSMFSHTLQFISLEAIFKKYCKKDICLEDMGIPPGLQSYMQKNYWPFIKYGRHSSGFDDTIFYVSALTSKRPREGNDSSDVKRCKRESAHFHNSEIRSDSPESSSSRGAKFPDHRLFQVPASSQFVFLDPNACTPTDDNDDVNTPLPPDNLPKVSERSPNNLTPSDNVKNESSVVENESTVKPSDNVENESSDVEN